MTSSKLILNYFPLSQPSRSVWQLLLENNIPFEAKSFHPLKGETQTKEFKAVTPTGHIPSIVDGKFTLWESPAILEYLCEKHNLTKWYPAGLEQRAKISEILSWQQKGCREIFTGLMLAEFTHKADDAKAKRAKVPDSVNFIQDNYLNKTKYLLTDDAPTIADLQIYHEVVLLQKVKMVDFTPYPRFEKWLQDMDALPHSAEIMKTCTDILKQMEEEKK